MIAIAIICSILYFIWDIGLTWSESTRGHFRIQSGMASFHYSHYFVSCKIAQKLFSHVVQKRLRYQALLKLYDLPGSLVVHQNGRTPNCAIDVRKYLDTQLLQSWIEGGGPIAKTVKSPNLTPSYYLMSFLSRCNFYLIWMEALNHLLPPWIMKLKRKSGEFQN